MGEERFIAVLTDESAVTPEDGAMRRVRAEGIRQMLNDVRGRTQLDWPEHLCYCYSTGRAANVTKSGIVIGIHSVVHRMDVPLTGATAMR